MRRRSTLAIGAVALALTLLAAACGGGGSSSSGNGNGNGQEKAAAGNLASSQVITVNWGTEPPSLDPGLATDTTSSNILLNVMDPLVRLDDKLQPKPSLAQSWDVSPNGRTVTFHLRHDGRWTNGDPVTAQDFVWSWKRTISPELAADYAYQFYGVVGAQAYNACKSNCAALADKVGVSAPDKYTLKVRLTSRQPWFLQQVAHHSFLAVNKKAVDRWGSKWTEASHIVTDGPFKLARWRHDAEIDLVKWKGWRDARDVTLTRVNGKMISDGTTAVQAFEAGETDADVIGPPPDQTPRFKGRPDYQVFPALGTYYYGFNVKNIPDVNQRRAMSLAIDRQTIIDNITQANQIPAQAYVPKGMPGFATIDVKSKWLPAHGDLDQAKQLMARVKDPVKNVTLWFNNAPGHKPIAIAVQSMWKKLGLHVTLKAQDFAQYLQFLGPPPNKAVDAFRLGWIADFPDAINFLEQWTCTSGNNNTNFCDPRYDTLVKKARQTPDDNARYGIYHQLQEILMGPNGQLPFTPIYWYTYPALVKESIKGTFTINPLDSVDLTKVQVRET
ncbi:MAG TPA: peptide ABC transporter substrate-binding protein [Gaiellaceae bacterium]|jgi:oligopeptide transport system substrate-binding protein